MFILVLQSCASHFAVVLVGTVEFIDITHTFAPLAKSARLGLSFILLFLSKAVGDFFALVYLIFHYIVVAGWSAGVSYAFEEINLILVRYGVAADFFILVEVFDMVINKIASLNDNRPLNINTNWLTFFKLALIDLI